MADNTSNSNSNLSEIVSRKPIAKFFAEHGITELAFREPMTGRTIADTNNKEVSIWVGRSLGNTEQGLRNALAGMPERVMVSTNEDDQHSFYLEAEREYVSTTSVEDLLG